MAVIVKLNKVNLERVLSEPGAAQTWLQNMAREIQQRARQVASEFADTGAVANSIDVVQINSYQEKPLVQSIVRPRGWRTVATARNSVFVEEGTGQQHYPDPRAPYWPAASPELLDWAQRNVPELIRYRRNGSPDLYLLQRHIHEHGTASRQFMRRALFQVIPSLQYIKRPTRG